MKLSIIIPIYNALEDVKILFSSLIENFNFNLGEIIIVNDFSTEETSSYLRKFCLKNKCFKLIENQENLGFVRTCNKGMKEAKNEIIVLLNSDTMIPNSFCEKIIKCFQIDKKIGVASPVSAASSEYYIPLPDGITLQKMNELLCEKHKCMYPLIPSAEGFCFCIRKEVIQKQGYLDEVWGKGYHEEVDFSYRAITNGYKNVLIDDLYVYHKAHASFGKEQSRKQIHKNNPEFQKRWRKFRHNYCRENNLVNPILKIREEVLGYKAHDNLYKKNSEKIFSIKNNQEKTHKVITLFGLKIKIKRK